MLKSKPGFRKLATSNFLKMDEGELELSSSHDCESSSGESIPLGKRDDN